MISDYQIIYHTNATEEEWADNKYLALPFGSDEDPSGIHEKKSTYNNTGNKIKILTGLTGLFVTGVIFLTTQIARRVLG